MGGDLVRGWRNYPTGDSDTVAFTYHRAVEVICGSVCRMRMHLGEVESHIYRLNEIVGFSGHQQRNHLRGVPLPSR